jgi:hypothetical protein
MMWGCICFFRHRHKQHRKYEDTQHVGRRVLSQMGGGEGATQTGKCTMKGGLQSILDT